MRVGSLFSGIGGLDLGLERAGMTVVWQCENEPYASKVLAKHWPSIPNLGDVTEVDWDALLADTESVTSCGNSRGNGHTQMGSTRRSERFPIGTATGSVDLVCGGFPCQDLSFAGRGGGITPGSRSGLWTEFARCVRALRPRYVLVENVPALLVRRPGMDVVAADLAALGYDLWWDCIPAVAVGAPHQRDRVFVVAHTSSARRRQDTGSAPGDESPDEGRAAQDDHVANCDGQGGGAGDVADADAERRDGWTRDERTGRWREPTHGGWWTTEPGLGRVVAGIPHRVDRLRCLGNAVVPQVAELIGRAILEADAT